jgi:hydrogenase-4 component B
MTPVILICAALLLLIGGMAVAVRQHPAANAVIYGASLAVSAAALAAALLQLLEGMAPYPRLILPIGLPWIGMHFAMDALASAFLILVNLGGAAASLYALGYGRHEHENQRVLPFFPVFLAAMNLVVIAADAYDFLLFWEFMSLASWALVMAHHEEAETRAAGYIYLVMASFGTLALLLAFGLLAGPQGHYAFSAMRAAHPASWIGAIVLILALLGAGSKAGLVPLHVWLPRAHPAAPSHVSALMSGVMTKVAIYGFIRIMFDLAGPSAWWWGLVVLLVGGVTAVLGMLYALLEEDIKIILAYSTIENIGIIFAGLGLALAFRADGLIAAAALAFTAALFHSFNHMLFKSALFFGAGAIQGAAGERRLGRLGGLIHRMRMSAVPILIAAMAISALPPLNGFASEWLLFQAILLSPTLHQWGLRLGVPATGALLALAAALAAVCFVRLFGFAFLGRARSPSAAAAQETDRFSCAAMIALAGLCIFAGLFPGLIIDAAAPVARSLLGARMPSQSTLPWLTIIPVSFSRSSYNGLLIFLFIAVAASLAVFVTHRFGSRAMRRGRFWDCGYPGLDVNTQYSPEGFAQPVRRVFGPLLFRVSEHVSMPAPGSTAPAHFRLDQIDPVWMVIYAPLISFINRAADRFNRMQFLTIRRYLGIVFLSLVLLLAGVALWQ